MKPFLTDKGVYSQKISLIKNFSAATERLGINENLYIHFK